MKAKSKERIKARELRSEGLSLGEIASILNVSKSSVSSWTSDITLSKAQVDSIELKATESRKRNLIVSNNWRKVEKQERFLRWEQEASEAFELLLQYPEFIYGLGLYAGEGGKTQEWFTLGNTDPMIISSIHSYVTLIGLTEEVTLTITVSSFQDQEEVWKFWSGIVPGAILKIRIYDDPRSNRTKVQGKMGVCSYYAHKSQELFVKTIKWIELLNNRV